MPTARVKTSGWPAPDHSIHGSRIWSQETELLLNHILEKLQSGKSTDFEFIGDELGNILGLVPWVLERRRYADPIRLLKAVDPINGERALGDVVLEFGAGS